MDSVAGADLLREVEAFLIHEARLMDEHRYDDWMALWEDELLYWVPCNEDEIDPSRHVSLIYDGRESLTQRVWRLKGKQAHAQRPKSRLLGDVRNAVQTVYFGRTAHTLTRRDGVLRMKRKKVMLLNNDAPLGNLTFLL